MTDGREMYPEAKNLQVGDVFEISGQYYWIVTQSAVRHIYATNCLPDNITIHHLEENF